MEIVEAHPFHVTRDADSEIQDLEAGDLLESVEEGVWQRRFADVVRVEINEAMPASVLEILVNNLELDRDDIYKITGPLSLVRVRHLAKVDRPDLKFAPFVPALPAALLKEARKKTSSPPSAAATFCSIIPSTPSSPLSACCRRPPTIPTCWPSRSRCTAWVATRRWWTLCWKRRRTASRSPCCWS